MTDTKAPERIWAWPDGFSGWYSAGASTEVNLGLLGYQADYQTTYIRADLYNELLRAADALADHVEAVAEWMRSNGYDDDADISAITAYKQAKERTDD
ncbi:hypothetical protein [Phaeobacter italicus]|jgi:hypothetical protein|uniref:hypothetical protein n=1 Tax=Phaeobacter italicus TaxID=481446 RepID=UPI002FDDA729